MMNDPYSYGKYVSSCYGMNWIETRMNQFGAFYYLLKSPLIQLGSSCCNTYMEGTDKRLENCWENNHEKFEAPVTVADPLPSS
jgi:hypothetical protein